MSTRLLPLAIIAVFALSGAGCRPKPTAQEPVRLPTPSPIVSDITDTGIMRLTGSADALAFDIEIMRIPWSTNGTFALVTNGVQKTGTFFANEESSSSSNLFFVTYDDEELGHLFLIWPTSQTNTLKATWTAKGSVNPVEIILATQPAAHAMKADYTSLSHTDQVTGNEICTFRSSYPLLVETEPNAQAINTLISKTAAGTLAENANSISLDQRASEYISDCVGEIQSLLNEFGPENAPPLAYLSDSSASITLNTKELISLRFDGYDYTGGAHGSPSLHGLTIHMDTGKAQTLKDLIKPSSLQALILKERQQLLALDQGEYLYDETLVEFQRFMSQTTMPEAAQLEQFGDEVNFYLTDMGIVLYHTAYEIAPYAAGQFETMIPYHEIKEMIRKDGPIGFFAN